MKKRPVFSSLLLLFSFGIISCSPNPENILRGSYKKCQSIRNGYYEMEKHIKLISRNDTIQVFHNRYFKKNTQDRYVPFIFNAHFQELEFGTKIHLLYTGENLVAYCDSTGWWMPKTGNEKHIWTNCVKNYVLGSYLPLTFPDSRPLPDSLMMSSGKIDVKYVKGELLNGLKCHHIKTIVPEEYDPSILKGSGYIVRTEIDYWINKQDSVPVQISIVRDMKFDEKTLVEYEKYVLKKYEVNIPIDDSLFSERSVPSFVNLQPLELGGKITPLPVGTIAPQWHLPSIKGDSLSLSDFAGELVLIDFFYTSCPPCIDYLPHLHDLHQKYKNSELHIIGLSCYDSQKTLNYFAECHGIEYPILIGNTALIDKYNVTGWPMTYLIGRDGEILYLFVGYDIPEFNRMNDVIEQHLKKL